MGWNRLLHGERASKTRLNSIFPDLETTCSHLIFSCDLGQPVQCTSSFPCKEIATSLGSTTMSNYESTQGCQCTLRKYPYITWYFCRPQHWCQSLMWRTSSLQPPLFSCFIWIQWWVIALTISISVWPAVLVMVWWMAETYFYHSSVGSWWQVRAAHHWWVRTG